MTTWGCLHLWSVFPKAWSSFLDSGLCCAVTLSLCTLLLIWKHLLHHERHQNVGCQSYSCPQEFPSMATKCYFPYAHALCLVPWTVVLTWKAADHIISKGLLISWHSWSIPVVDSSLKAHIFVCCYFIWSHWGSLLVSEVTVSKRKEERIG